MSSNTRPDALHRDTILRCRYWNLISCGHEDKKEVASLELTFPEWNTTENKSSDAGMSIKLPSQCFFESEDKVTDCTAKQCLDELCQIIPPTTNDATNHSSHYPVFDREKVEQIGECFKHVLYECSADSSSNALNSSASEVLHRSVEIAIRMVTLSALVLTYSFVKAQGDEVQQTVLRQARANPNFMRDISEFGEVSVFVVCFLLVSSGN